MQARPVRYVALGDSYTIGTAVDEHERWPNRLVARIPELELVANPAVNGFTSGDLVREELPVVAAARAELVTVLIGVNDVVRGVPDADYRATVGLILDRLVAQVGSGRVITVATPDYTRTPRGGDYGDPERQRAAIVAFNAMLRQASEARDVAHVAEIFAISTRVADDPTMVAPDGLHPSGAQYELWVDAIEPIVRRLLGD
jgi:lysophospholipase L1-like esterase